jgi:putative two-component system response regulator
VTTSRIAQFRALVKQVQQASDPQIKRALVRVASESKERLAASSPAANEFFEELRSSLWLLRGNGNAELRIGCLLDCANFFYVAGDIAKGVQAARDAFALSSSAGHEQLARKSLTFLGNLLADAGALAEGIEAYVEAIERSIKLGDLEGHAKTMMNLGVGLFYAAQYSDAIVCLERAEALARSSSYPNDALYPSLQINKALCHLQLEDVDAALNCARLAITSSAAPTSGPEILARIIRECTYVQVLIEAKQMGEARLRLPPIKDYALRAASQKASVMAAVAEGLVEIFTGDAALGIHLLQQAQSKAAGVNSLEQDALIGLVKGYEAMGQHQKALACLQHLMNSVRKMRQQCAAVYLRGELAQIRQARLVSASDLRTLEHREALLRAKVAEDQLAWSQIEMLERLAVTADLREEASGEHGYRVGRLSAAMAEDLGWNAEACLSIDLAARLHDIGKIGIPDRILLTSQELKAAERHFMCTHTTIGAELLAKSNIPKLRMAEDIALYHHESWDGSGYPGKVHGKRIPIHARIVAIADVFDALTHGRPYAEPWEMDKAIDEIRARRGRQFDPELVDRFVVLIAALRAQHPNLDEFLARAGRNSPFLQARRKIKLMLEQEREQERDLTVAGNETRH